MGKHLALIEATLLSCIIFHLSSAVSIQPSRVVKSRLYYEPILKLRNGAQDDQFTNAADQLINAADQLINAADQLINAAEEINTVKINGTISMIHGAPLSQNETLSVSDDAPAVTENNADPNLLRTLQLTAFLQVFSNSICMFAPTAALVKKIGSSRATSILSILSAGSALIQILFAPIVGSILDSSGRKPTMYYAQSLNALIKIMVAFNPTTFSLCAAKVIVTICSGFSALSAQAVISDIAATNSSQMSSAIGYYMATLTSGFLVGSVLGGKLSEFGLPVIYGVSSFIATMSVLTVKFALLESLPAFKRVPLKSHNVKGLLLKSPVSSIRLLTRHSNEVRILAIVLMMQVLPSNMGDVFQIFVKQEWKLSTKDFSYLISMYGVLGIASNVISSMLVKKIGIKRFTGLAILSSLLSPIGSVIFGIKGLIGGNFLGFLGSAQTMGIIAALVSEGVKSGAPLGELAGERSSLIELLKVIGPLWYSTLYLQGQKFFGTGYLPFIFNICVGVTALIFSQKYLS